jgi:hypothetical protein
MKFSAQDFDGYKLVGNLSTIGVHDDVGATRGAT